MTLQVTLNELELQIGALVGKTRYEQSRAQHLTNLAEDYDPSLDTFGAQGEMAVAKALGVYYTPTVNTFHEADLGDNLQVRATKYREGRLIVRESDPDDHIFILVRHADHPEFEVVGWVYGHEAKKKKYLTSPNGRRPAYYVHNHDLHPIEDLPGYDIRQGELVTVDLDNF